MALLTNEPNPEEQSTNITQFDQPEFVGTTYDHNSFSESTLTHVPSEYDSVSTLIAPETHATMTMYVGNDLVSGQVRPLEELAGQAPARVVHRGGFGRSLAVGAMAALAMLFLGLATVGCNGTPENPNDTGSMTDTYDGGDGSDVPPDETGNDPRTDDGTGDPSVEEPMVDNALGAVEGDSQSPQNGATIGPDDNPLTITATAPDASGSYEGPVDVVVEIEYERTGDTDTVIDDTTTPGGDVTTNVDIADLVDGDTMTVTYTFTARDAAEPNSRGYVAQVTYENGVNPDAPVVYCVLSAANVGSWLALSCNGTSPLGHSLDGNWTLETDLEDMEIYETGVISGPVMGPGHVGLHYILVSVHDGHGNSTDYENQFFVDLTQTTVRFDGGGEIQFPEDFADEISQDCGEGFNTGNKPTSMGQAAYTFEISRAANGAAAMTCVLDKIDGMQRELALTMTMYTGTGETLSEFVGGEVDLVQFTYRSSQ